MYEYICQDCGERFESLVRGQEEVICPYCQSKNLKRLISACGFNFGKDNTKANTSLNATKSCSSCSAFS
jgi:putative FmdB family regulatory protein